MVVDDDNDDSPGFCQRRELACIDMLNVVVSVSVSINYSVVLLGWDSTGVADLVMLNQAYQVLSSSGSEAGLRVVSRGGFKIVCNPCQT